MNSSPLASEMFNQSARPRAAQRTEARLKAILTQVLTQDVSDERLIASLAAVARESFLPQGRAAFAYADCYHPIAGDEKDNSGGGRNIAPMAQIAQLIELAKPQAEEAVLHIGCNYGYASAVLSLMCAQVYAVESDKAFCQKASRNLRGFGNVAVREAPLRLGVRWHPPKKTGTPAAHDDQTHAKKTGWDAIIIEGAVETFPLTLYNMLTDGGRLTCCTISNGVCEAKCYVKRGSQPQVQRWRRCNLSILPEFSAAEEDFVF